MNTENISFFFQMYLSDKLSNGYAPVYDEIFSSRRYDHIKLLEIGIGTLNSTESNMLFWKEYYDKYLPGASLKAFRDYFSYGYIFGIDIQSDCMFDDERISTFLVDSTDTELCNRIFGQLRFDFIIDDGNHHHTAQIKTFENFFSLLKSNGIYIIEDLAYPEEIYEYFNGRYSYTKHETDSGKLIYIRK